MLSVTLVGGSFAAAAHDSRYRRQVPERGAEATLQIELSWEVKHEA